MTLLTLGEAASSSLPLLHHLGHLAYAISALSFLFRDFFWLRLLAICASSTMIVWVTTSLDQWFTSAFWHGVFVLINTVMLIRLIHGERTARFSPEEMDLHRGVFPSLSKLEFLKLLRAGAWRDSSPDEALTTQGQLAPCVLLISRGLARVEVDGRVIARLRPGQFIGEMSYTTGEPASATVRADEALRCLAWKREELASVVLRNPTLRFALAAAFGTDLSRKLRGSATVPPPEVGPPHPDASPSSPEPPEGGLSP